MKKFKNAKRFRILKKTPKILRTQKVCHSKKEKSFELRNNFSNSQLIQKICLNNLQLEMITIKLNFINE